MTEREDIKKALLILGVESGTDWPVVRKRYATCVRNWHPDRAPSDNSEWIREATEETKRLNWANDVLRKHFRSASHHPTICCLCGPDPPLPQDQPVSQGGETARSSVVWKQVQLEAERSMAPSQSLDYLQRNFVWDTVRAAGHAWILKVKLLSLTDDYGAMAYETGIVSKITLKKGRKVRSGSFGERIEVKVFSRLLQPSGNETLDQIALNFLNGPAPEGLAFYWQNTSIPWGKKDQFSFVLSLQASYYSVMSPQ